MFYKIIMNHKCVCTLSNLEVNRSYLIFEAQKDMSLNDFLVCSLQFLNNNALVSYL